MAVIEHESRRQVELIEEGGTVAQETRLYDPDKSITRSLHSKEDAHDYRYFPDPDLLPLELDDAFLEECRSTLPELPDAKRKRYEDLDITSYNASVLTTQKSRLRAGSMRCSMQAPSRSRQQTGWSPNCSERSTAAAKASVRVRSRRSAPAELLGLVADGTISGTIAKQVFEIMLETGQGAGTIVEERGLKQTSDTGAIDSEIDKVLAANADKVAEYKSGKEQFRILRRPDDESHGWKGQPEAGQRAASGEIVMKLSARQE